MHFATVLVNEVVMLLLSYSRGTKLCGRVHRCHVMERESFESQAVAKVLNEHFVSIKASGVG